MLRLIICTVLLVSLTINAAASGGPLDINVVYPKPDQRLPAVDSTFIFGSVAPGSILTINGQLVDVHKGGGWLAFLPVDPGPFEFSIRAVKNDIIDTMTLSVQFPDLPETCYDSLYFRPGSYAPSSPLWVRAGDRIKISFGATPYCNAFCVIGNTSDTIPMIEAAPEHYYRGRNVFDVSGRVMSDISDSFLIRGVYRGSFNVPDVDDDSLTLIYHIYPPSLLQLTWMIKLAGEFKAKPLPFHQLGAMEPIRMDTLKTPIRILRDESPAVIELTDSLTVIRTGPRKGYLCIHQPSGIRAELAGRSGDWLKIKLSDYQYGYVPDTAAVILPEGSTVPHSYVSSIRTVDYEDRASVVVATSARHAFRIVENIKEPSLSVFLYGVDSDTDWIRYDNRDSLIDHIVWLEPEPGVYGLKIYLKEERIWGYDGYYIGDQFHFDIKKFPAGKSDISDFRFVIDPGHSPDLGAVGPTGLTEKDANLLISLRLQKDLEREGAEVILTRSGDDSLPLYDRPRIAVREKADIFISVHNNALPPGTNPFVNNGISTYYYHAHSAGLARAVQNSFVRHIDLNDFGWYYANFAVNRSTQYPAILVECAFMMLPEQEAMLRTDKFRKKISKSIVEGVKDFLRGRTLTDWDTQQIESYGW